MWSLKTAGAVVTAGATLTALTGLAIAEEAPEEEPVEEIVAIEEVGEHDSIFNFGFDEKLHLFVFNLTGPSSELNCSVGNGPVETTYGVNGDDVRVETLTRDGVPVTFEPRDTGDGEEAEEGAEPVEPVEGDPVDSSVPYTPDGECGLQAHEVAGPNGQINHGMFMKLFNSLYDGTGRGCINRHLAQSDLGQGEQQIRVGDVEPDFVSVMAGDEGGFDMTTIVANCEHGRDKNADKGNGKPEKAEKPGKPENRGQSGDNGHGQDRDKPGKGHDK